MFSLMGWGHLMISAQLTFIFRFITFSSAPIPPPFLTSSSPLFLVICFVLCVHRNHLVCERYGSNNESKKPSMSGAKKLHIKAAGFALPKQRDIFSIETAELQNAPSLLRCCCRHCDDC